MRISTSRFGELEIPDDKIIHMAKPVLGFENLKKYCLISGDDCEPFLWYQSVEDPEIAFIIVNPVLFYPEYRIEINPKEIEELKVDDTAAIETYVIVTVPNDPPQMSINLQGPILVNTQNRIAKQLILVNSNYNVRHYIFDGMPETDKKVGEDFQEKSPLRV